MGTITLGFGNKCYVTTPVTTCKLAAQNVLSLNACSYHAGSGHCIRDISLIWLINMINTQCRPAFMSMKLVLSRVHVLPARSGQHDAGWHVSKPGNKSRTTPAWQLDHVNPAYSLKRHIMKIIIKIMITIKMKNNNSNNNDNNNNYGTVI